jgi:[ribosomal protein S18]-alanine N-acetyltransferase
MNALLQPVHALEAQFEAMSSDWLEAVVRLEQSAYGHPWTHGNFSDSITAGYTAQMLVGGRADSLRGRPVGQLLGYFVAMKGVDEVHLLNITVAPDHQHQGWARVMLDALSIWARGEGAQWLWLEVRVSNARARMVYERYGFREVGLRRGYYPAGSDRISRREDAIVMSFAL